MPIGKGEGDRERDMAGEAYIRKLRKTFEEMPHDIPLLLFADRGGRQRVRPGRAPGDQGLS